MTILILVASALTAMALMIWGLPEPIIRVAGLQDLFAPPDAQTLGGQPPEAFLRTDTPLDAATLEGHPGLFFRDAGNLIGWLHSDRYSAYADLEAEARIAPGSTLITTDNLPPGNPGTITGIATGLGLRGGGTEGNIELTLVPGTGITLAADGTIKAILGSTVELASETTGVLQIAQGGTGRSTPPPAGQLLVSDGTGIEGVALLAGPGITLTRSAQALTLAATGVHALTGTANQIVVTGSDGLLTLALPQDVHTGASPTFYHLTLSDGLTIAGGTISWPTTEPRAVTLPDASGVLCLDTGNCAGAGNGLVGAGSAGQLAVFTGLNSLSSDAALVWDTATQRLGIGVAEPAAALHVVGTITSPGIGDLSETFGFGATATGYRDLSVGRRADAQSNSTAIGTSTSATNQSVAVGLYAQANQQATAIGSQADAFLFGTAVGRSARANGPRSVALGSNANSTATGSIALGVDSRADEVGALVAGSAAYPITNLYFGNGRVDEAPTAFTLNGTGGDGIDVAGGGLRLAGGRGTGNASGGAIAFQTSDAGVSGAELQALTTKMVLTSSGHLGLGTSSPDAMFHVDGGGLLVTGDGSTGSAPVSGGGRRLMWIPGRAAFRAGYVIGSEWDTHNIGSYSFAANIRTIAKGTGSTALGGQTVAEGIYSTAVGHHATAGAASSLAFGKFVTANADSSVVIGRGPSPSNRLVNDTDSSLVIGFNSDIPTLFVGPGDGEGTSGAVGIGTTDTQSALTFATGTTSTDGITFGIDTNLYRSDAGTLTTDGLFVAGSGLRIAEGTMISGHFSATSSWDPASLASGTATSTTVAVPGATMGDTVAVGFDQAPADGMAISGWVSAPNTVTVTITNLSGTTQDLPSGTVRADVWQH